LIYFSYKILIFLFRKFNIAAEARGKELMVTLTNPTSSSQKITVVFTHGLVCK